MKSFRTCLKSTVCRVRTAHQPLKAPEGSSERSTEWITKAIEDPIVSAIEILKVYSNADSPYINSPSGDQANDQLSG